MNKLLCFLLALMLPACALAQSVTLPKNVAEIAQEAFRGDTSIREVTIPDGTALIGAGAFEDCSSLQTADVPASVVTIGMNAFEGCAPALLIRTQAGSAAMTYAVQNLIDYQADTTYRALLIGQCQYESPIKPLTGPKNDVAAMAQALGSHTGTPYQCTVREDLTASDIEASVKEVFANAKAQDVSLLYYSGHGVSGGMLVGTDRKGISPTSLRNLLDRIPGRKIVIVDACNSGAIISRSSEATTAEAFNEAFVSAFSLKKRSDLAADSYYVITACRGVEYSVEMQLASGMAFGLFTRYLCDGLGYDYVKQTAGSLLADENGDGVVSIAEAWDYAGTMSYNKYPQQSAQVYPANCFYQGLVR